VAHPVLQDSVHVVALVEQVAQTVLLQELQAPALRYFPAGHEVQAPVLLQVEHPALQAKVQEVADPLHVAHTVLLQLRQAVPLS